MTDPESDDAGKGLSGSPSDEETSPATRAAALDKMTAETDPVFRQLRTLYDDVVNEPLPDELMTLLDKLDEAERKR